MGPSTPPNRTGPNPAIPRAPQPRKPDPSRDTEKPLVWKANQLPASAITATADEPEPEPVSKENGSTVQKSAVRGPGGPAVGEAIGEADVRGWQCADTDAGAAARRVGGLRTEWAAVGRAMADVVVAERGFRRVDEVATTVRAFEERAERVGGAESGARKRKAGGLEGGRVVGPAAKKARLGTTLVHGSSLAMEGNSVSSKSHAFNSGSGETVVDASVKYGSAEDPVDSQETGGNPESSAWDSSTRDAAGNKGTCGELEYSGNPDSAPLELPYSVAALPRMKERVAEELYRCPTLPYSAAALPLNKPPQHPDDNEL
ncbi:hypothetical protein AOQ84DRAFT_407818 [Glonium stellatum]|uniref:Uncharacterized protein n=1 Tax=Glonium stellatum TaxID=574774 RepID=A0A8E2FC02_9PEZI|nr:hypothetical protein AOQ84DRAFT_407818 [Glonium stellatum]